MLVIYIFAASLASSLHLTAMGWWGWCKIFFIKSENLFMTIFIYISVYIYKVSTHGRHQRTIKCSSCVRARLGLSMVWFCKLWILYTLYSLKYGAYKSLYNCMIYGRMSAKLCTTIFFYIPKTMFKMHDNVIFAIAVHGIFYCHILNALLILKSAEIWIHLRYC